MGLTLHKHNVRIIVSIPPQSGGLSNGYLVESAIVKFCIIWFSWSVRVWVLSADKGKKGNSGEFNK